MLLGEKVNEHFPDLLGCQIGIHLKGKKNSIESSDIRSGTVLPWILRIRFASFDQFNNECSRPKQVLEIFEKRVCNFYHFRLSWRNWKHATFTLERKTTTTTTGRDFSFLIIWVLTFGHLAIKSKEVCTMTLYMLLCCWSPYYGAKSPDQCQIREAENGPLPCLVSVLLAWCLDTVHYILYFQ